MSEEVSGRQANVVEGWWERNFKNHLAALVFVCSFGGVLLTASWTLGQSAEIGRQIFNVLAPLFGTWVGTILAFYFSRENFKEANDAVSRLVDRVTPEQRLARTPVRDVMKPRASIKARDLKEGEEEGKIAVRELMKLVGEGYSRVLIFTPRGVIKYVIHESTLNKFIADRSAPIEAGAPLPAPPLDASLTELLAHRAGSQTIGEIARRFVFVKEEATLADARAAMLAVKGCEDVFVTKSGKQDEPVLGWLTNTDITRDL
ncbi:hypothetical protein ACFFP0_20935 [Rhizobium puerariae]|uniref:CBS domain-containing protein n=1 Tax=Rhizobium puerariae TaxID=1585791 RepID=A0ABV6AL23_9HYPH